MTEIKIGTLLMQGKIEDYYKIPIIWQVVSIEYREDLKFNVYGVKNFNHHFFGESAFVAECHIPQAFKIIEDYDSFIKEYNLLIEDRMKLLIKALKDSYRLRLHNAKYLIDYSDEAIEYLINQNDIINK